MKVKNTGKGNCNPWDGRPVEVGEVVEIEDETEAKWLIRHGWESGEKVVATTTVDEAVAEMTEPKPRRRRAHKREE